MSILRALALLAAILSLSLPSAAADAQDIKERSIKFAFLHPMDHPQGTGAQKFAELVDARSAGKIKVQLFPSGTQGSDLHTISDLQDGVTQMTVLDAGLLAGQVKEFAAFDLPFLFRNAAEANAVADGPFGKRLLDKLAPTGMVGICYWSLGFRHLTNSKRPVRSIDNIRGLKIRVMLFAAYAELFTTLDADAVPLPFTEVFKALEQKTVDGQESPLATILGARLDEVQPYLTLTRHVYSTQVVLMSKKFWDGLSSGERQLIMNAAMDAQTYQRQAALAREEQALGQLKKSGMQVAELPPAELERMRELAKPVTARFGRDFKDVMTELDAEIAKARK